MAKRDVFQEIIAADQAHDRAVLAGAPESEIEALAQKTRALMATPRETAPRVVDQFITDQAALYNGDSCEVLKSLPDESVGYTIYSPPFSSLYIYSNSPRDLGNCRDYEEFFEHYRFITKELYRVTKPGRLLSFHCMLLPTTKEHDGFMGLRDFRGDLIRAHQADGFVFHSEVVIWKDPLIAATRTHAHGLAHKELVKDSAVSRQGIPDYLVTMRKPGVNLEPISHKPSGLSKWIGEEEGQPKGEFHPEPGKNKQSHLIWQRYASPVWMDINPSKTLQGESAREHQDERHICPLQLQVIERALELWSNPGDVVLSPFAGIGSEIYSAVKMGRRGIGIELKESYYKQACANIRAAEKEATQSRLDFSGDE